MAREKKGRKAGLIPDWIAFVRVESSEEEEGEEGGEGGEEVEGEGAGSAEEEEGAGEGEERHWRLMN